MCYRMRQYLPRHLVTYLKLNYSDLEFCRRKKESNIYKENEYIQVKQTIRLQKYCKEIAINVNSGYPLTVKLLIIRKEYLKKKICDPQSLKENLVFPCIMPCVSVFLPWVLENVQPTSPDKQDRKRGNCPQVPADAPPD